MIFRKHKVQRYIERELKIPVKVLMERASVIRDNFENIAICPVPTHYNWKGVNSASKDLFDGFLLEIPQYYSSPVYSKREQIEIAGSLNELKFSNIVFSGFVPYYSNLISLITNSDTKVGLLYHGFLSELSENPGQREILSIILQLCHEDKIRKLGFNKKGLCQTIHALFGINAYDLLLKTKVTTRGLPKKSHDDGKIHIGIMANKQIRKNLHNQVAAALMVENSIVHVSDDSELSYLGNAHRIVAHGNDMPRDKYLKQLETNDLNLYVSYSESWGMVITESLALGVPCLAANTSALFDYDDELRNKLVVQCFDDSNEIYKQILCVLKEKMRLSELGKTYIEKLNLLAEEKLMTFLNA